MNANRVVLYGTLTLCSIAVITASEATAQSRFLQEGHSGFGLSGSFSSGEDFTQLGGAFGYSVNGQVEFFLGVSRASFDEKEFGEDFSGTNLSPGASVTVVRPTPTSIVGMEIGAGYGHMSFSGDALDALGWDMSSNAYNVGAELYLKLRSSPALQVIPSVGAYYASVTSTIEDSYNNSVDDDVSDVLFSAGLSFLFNDRVHITPFFSTFDGSSSWGVAVGMVIPSQ